MDVVSRVKQFMEATQLSSSQFADAAGIPRPTLSQLFNGRNGNRESAKKVSSELLTKIHIAFPELNMMWLLFGDGDMVTATNIEISEPQKAIKMPLFPTQNTDRQKYDDQNLFSEDLSNFSSEKLNESDFENLSSQPSPFQAVHTAPHINPTSSEVPSLSLSADSRKRIQSIMVFYSDNSFEVFKPAKESKSK